MRRAMTVWALNQLFAALDAKSGYSVRRTSDPSSPARTLFNRFCRLVSENCHAERGVDWYAGQLCITPNYLYKITYKAVQISPKELIDRQIVLEIKDLLATTDMTVQEIADRFNFAPYYLSRFFRKHIGMSPVEYRKISLVE